MLRRKLLRVSAVVVAATALFSTPDNVHARGASAAFACTPGVCTFYPACLPPEDLYMYQWACDVYCGSGWYIGGCTENGGCTQVVCHHMA